ncbi:hypothetical protein Tco_0229565 [Tanacetum coccineum]
MLAPKCATYNGRSTFANPKYLKIAQSEKPCLYEIPYDTSDHANRFAPNREETMTLDNKSRSKLDKDTVKPYDYTRQIIVFMKFLKDHHWSIFISWNAQKKLGRQCGENRLLDQVCGNPTMPVQTRRQLATDPEMKNFISSTD